MNAKFGSQFGQRQLTLDGFQSHIHFELSRVVFAG